MLNQTEGGGTSPIEFQSPDGQSLSTIMQNGQPLFMAIDLVKKLGLKHITNAISKLPDEEKLTVKVLQSGQAREMWFVTEPGMYRLIFRSNKPEAEIFQRWVFHEVLPQIRQTGSYTNARRKYIESDVEKTLFIKIAMHLRIGDIIALAKEHGWSKDRVSRVKRGITIDQTILTALATRAAWNQRNPLRKYAASFAASQLNMFQS